MMYSLYDQLSFNVINEDVSHGKEINVLDPKYIPKGVKDIAIDELMKDEHMSREDAERMLNTRLNSANKQLNTAQATGGDLGHAKVSLHGEDPIYSNMLHNLELYDKNLDEQILKSDDLVKAYNELINARFDKAYKLMLDYNKYVETLDEWDDKRAEADKKFAAVAVHKGLLPDLAAMGNLESISKNLGQGSDDDYNISENDIKKWIVGATYGTIDNPEVVKKIVKARIDFNNAVTSILRVMVQINYRILGLSKDQAMALSGKLNSPDIHQQHKGVKEAKQLIKNNANKYKVGKSNYDFRELGLGCVFKTDEDMGPIEDTVSIDRLVPMLSKYDAIVIGHGGVDGENLDKLYKSKIADMRREEAKDRKDMRKKIDALRDEKSNLETEFWTGINNKVPFKSAYVDSEIVNNYNKARESLVDQIQKTCEDNTMTYNEREAKVSELKKELKQLTDERSEYIELYGELYNEFREKQRDIERRNINNKQQKIQDEIDNMIEEDRKIHEKYRKKSNAALQKSYKTLDKRGLIRWTIQPIHTLTAGPFTDVNDLVHQLIKEGFKNIMMVACNPGGKSLDKDIINNHDVHVHHATSSLLGESTYQYYDTGDTIVESIFRDIDANMQEAEQDLRYLAETSNIDYNDNSYLNECIEYFDNYTNKTVLTEGVVGSVWEGIVNLVKKAIGFLVGLFKKMIGLVGKVLAKIKEFFAKIFSSNKFDHKLRKPISSGAIMLENARLVHGKVDSWEELQSQIIGSCEKITAEIKKYESQQVNNMKDMEKFAEQKAKETKNAEEDINKAKNSADGAKNENATKMDAICALLF